MGPRGRLTRPMTALALVLGALAVTACGADGPTTAPSRQAVGSAGAPSTQASAAPSLGTAAAPSTTPGSTASPSVTPTTPPPSSPSPPPTPVPTPQPTQAPTPTARPAKTPAPSTARWIPKRGTTWQWQLSGRIDLTVRAAVFDLDVDDTSAKTVAALHRKGRHVICYVDVGTWESYRADAKRFPKRLLGKVVDGWPDERWLDIRDIDALAPILRARLDVCARKGFDAVEPDWLNHYEEDTGFPITRAQSVRFATWVAREAHRRGLSIAQKNAPGLVASLVGRFDFAITEDCALYDECGAYRAYLRRGRAVLDAEYEQAPAAFCRETRKLGVSAIRKKLELGAWRRVCP